jgi:NADPH-dependent 2,4-dienoyl-CoA reductase/sulfur reductase-like enzyme
MAWYTAREIDLRLGVGVASIDLAAHSVVLEGGDLFHYDKLLLAPGATPRRLRNVAGESLAGIYTLRSLADSDALIAAVSQGKRVVVIGASFIGLEVASSLANARQASVTVVAIEETPFDRILGVEIGRMFQREHETNGIQFRLKTSVARFIGTEGRVSAVELTNGETLPADFVVLGVGVAPATDCVASAGVKLDEKDRSVLVNDQLQSSDPDVYAAGDIAKVGGTRIEHWRLAEQHGIVAAHTMLGQEDSAAAHVPFFWTNQWSIIFNYVGHAEKWDEIIFRGSPDNNDFLAFYVTDGKLLAAAGCNHDRDLDAIEFILRDKLPLTTDQMRDPGFDLVAFAGKV